MTLLEEFEAKRKIYVWMGAIFKKERFTAKMLLKVPNKHLGDRTNRKIFHLFQNIFNVYQNMF